ncbi:hypothetical protein G3I60_43050 [Streptomyces sp. SID13666]|nr:MULTISPECIES: hypothetical protein [Streptomyces]MCZ4100501.1 hypothetical protein [Streptomyces sp. H39-C1]NEA60767.1 hypothetical protein [Streptomyces sp. SID13666]NEA73967.1 hypothetical protein [Streptomyces sp. SID13588]QNA76093.1 hypothetical protein C8250_033155 [Streptomyces sp. So13.3]
MRPPYVAITVHGLSWNATVSGRSGTSPGPSGKLAGTVGDGPGQSIF